MKVFIFDMLLNHHFYDSEAYASFFEYQNTLVEVVEEGKSQGVFSSELNARVSKTCLSAPLFTWRCAG